MMWKLAHFTDEGLLQFVTDNGKHLPPAVYEFSRHMIKYGIGHGFQEEDLIPLGGVESTSFEGNQAKIIKAVKRYVDMMRKDKDTIILPSEARLLSQEDHVHHIFITNNEKHMVFVTCDALIINPVMEPIFLSQLGEVRIDLPFEKEEELIGEHIEDAQHDVKENQTDPEKNERVARKLPFAAEKPEEVQQEREDPPKNKNQTLTKQVIGAVSDGGRRIFLQVIEHGGNSEYLSQDAAFIADVTLEEYE